MSTYFSFCRKNIAAVILASLTCAPHYAQAQAPTPTPTPTPQPAFFIIGNNRAEDNRQALSSCSETAHRLSGQLKSQDVAVFELLNPSAIDLRVALSSFARHLEHKQAVIAYCGVAWVQNDRIFLANDDKTGGLLNHAVVANSLLRAAGGQNGLVFLELHPAPGQEQALSRAISLLKNQAEGQANLSVTLVTSPAADPVMDGLTSATQPGWQLKNLTALAHADSLPEIKSSESALPSATPAPEQTPDWGAPLPPSQAIAPETKPVTETKPDSQDAYPVPANTTASDAVPPPAPSSSENPQVPASVEAEPSPPPAQKPPPPPVKKENLKAQKAREKAMRHLQVNLLAKGYYGGTINGVKTVETINAIKKFQRSRHEPATGNLTDFQAAALFAPVVH